ncbi:MAG: RNA polymerase sigma factor [Pirellula sp.]|jgi:RNA polymerase sigma-70 factor (ECF subfamily)
MDSEAFINASPAATELPTRSSLISGLKTLSSDRWTSFILVYSPLLKFWIQRKGVSGPAVEDVLQECLQSICVGIGSFQRDAAKGKFRGWLRTIVERRVADHFRDKPLELTASTQVLVNIPTPDQKDPTAIEEEMRLLQEIRIRALQLVRQSTTEKTWQMFWLSTVEQVPTADIAQQFGVTTAAVRVAKKRVLERLRYLMVEDFDCPSVTSPGESV